MLKAVIFDMDGVIIDSEPMHARAAILALKQYHVDITTDYLSQFIGSTTYYMCRRMIEEFQLDATVEDLYNINNNMKAYLLQKEGHTVIPYIVDLMKDLHKNGIVLTIASSSPAEAIEGVMDSLHIREYFDGYVSGMMVSHPKPAPDIFIEAANRLGVSPEECIVIEDSSHGVTAAVAAGMTCIGYLNPNSGKQDLGKATMLVEGFDEIDYEFILGVYQNDHMKPKTILTTEHFILRELTVEDIDQLHPICIKPEIYSFLDDYDKDPTVEKEKHRAYIQNIYRYYGFGLWGVFLKDNDNLIGCCGVEFKTLDGEEVYELGYLLDTNYQGKGYAKEYVSETIHYCFAKLNICRIVAIIDKNNSRSLHLAEQVGMENIGECIRFHRDCYKYEIKKDA